MDVVYIALVGVFWCAIHGLAGACHSLQQRGGGS